MELFHGSPTLCDHDQVVQFEPEDAVWERFRSGQVTLTEIQESPLLQRWWRSATAGVHADEGSGVRAVLPATELTARREKLRVAFPRLEEHIDKLGTDLAEYGLVAIVADPEGYVLHVRGGGSFGERARNAELVDGALWSEAARGTNGIGTTLAEGRPVSVLGRAHYDRANHDLFCCGTPLRSPQGGVAAVLSIAGHRASHSPHVALVLSTTIRLIEEEASASTLTQSGVLGGFRSFEKLLNKSGIGALLIEAPGTVRFVNERALLLLGAKREKGPVTAQRMLGMDFGQLKSQAMSGRGSAAIATLQGTVRLELEPLLDRQGEVFAVVAYVETMATSVPPPRIDPARSPFGEIIGSDRDLRETVRLCERFAKTDIPILIVAETGTGKELLANGIHRASARASGPFVAVNCGAFSASLLESELFGYAPGAFTGARSGGHVGKLGAANGGTLFLDEVAEMPEPLQAMLLRVLEDGSYYRIGDNQLRHADIRIVCATAIDLAARVQQGRFRQDLFFRIQGVAATLPPLRHRTDKVELANGLIARSLAHRTGPIPRLSPEAESWIEAHSWPGNVRELKSAIRHALVMLDGETTISLKHLPRAEARAESDSMQAAADSVTSVTRIMALPPDSSSLRDIEVEAAVRAVTAANGNVSEAARRLGVARSTLYRILRKQGP